MLCGQICGLYRVRQHKPSCAVNIFQGLLFLFFGVGFAGRSLSLGSLPCGPNGLKGRIELHRKEQPFLYWLAFAMYALAGLWLTVFAVRLLVGSAQPLPLS